MAIGLQHYLTVGAILFAIGLFGVLGKRNVIAVLMGIELLFNAVNLTFIAFSKYVTPTLLTGQVFALFVIVVAAAEAAVALAIVFAIYRYRRTSNLDEIDLMKG